MKHEEDYIAEERWFHSYGDMVQTTKLLGVFFLTADYFRYSLGFSQLASMAELALVIRESVKLVKIER